MQGSGRQGSGRQALAAVTGLVLAGVGLVAAGPAQADAAVWPSGASSGACALGNGIRHVIGLQFDNVHLTRDDPNVPSDLEQMPHLLNFLRGNGSLLTRHHDVLAHTATNEIATQTGLYQDRNGVTQSNSFRYFRPDGTTSTGVSFAYWTAPLFDPGTASPTDTTYNEIYSADRAANPTGANVNVPAPWVPYTRAGCDVGEVAVGNTVLENTSVDIPTVFGANSPQAAEVAADPAQAFADTVGLGVHCARTSNRCASGEPDLLPSEPGGYTGFSGLFGSAQLQPAVHPGGPFTSLSGRVIADGAGHVGFPGFDAMTPDVSLGYLAALQESGVPVTYAYLSDAHTDHTGALHDLGPGEAASVAQLKSYDTAFATFLTRMAADGITPDNTLFAVTTDEGDHFVGGPPSPAGCDGVTTPCSYAAKGEINVNLPGLLAAQTGNRTALTMHNDPAPSIYVTGNPSRTDPAVRQLTRDLAGLTYTSPLTGSTTPLTHWLADPVEEKILHYVSADPARTPTLTLFAGENEYLYNGGQACAASGCVSEPPAFAWNHGGVEPDMTGIWLGLVGPGVRHLGVDTRTWSDQTDIRPTTLALVGLRDDYAVDGRVLTEDLSPASVSPWLRGENVRQLGELYKQLLAGPGRFGLDTLAASTAALGSSDETRYAWVESRLQQLGAQRDAVTAQMRDVLLGAAFHGQRVDPRTAERLIDQGSRLLAAAHTLARTA